MASKRLTRKRGTPPADRRRSGGEGQVGESRLGRVTNATRCVVSPLSTTQQPSTLSQLSEPPHNLQPATTSLSDPLSPLRKKYVPNRQHWQLVIFSNNHLVIIIFCYLFMNVFILLSFYVTSFYCCLHCMLSCFGRYSLIII